MTPASGELDENVTDEALVASVIATADDRAFEQLVRRHQSGVRGWLRQLTGDFALADDLAQQTFLLAWDRLGSYRGSGRFRSWIMAIAWNEYRQFCRSESRERRKRAEFGRSEIASHAEADESHAELPKLLAALNDDEKAAMILCYSYGMSHGEIAKVTGWPLGTVKSHIRRGKSRIRERFALEGIA